MTRIVLKLAQKCQKHVSDGGQKTEEGQGKMGNGPGMQEWFTESFTGIHYPLKENSFSV